LRAHAGKDHDAGPTNLIIALPLLNLSCPIQKLADNNKGPEVMARIKLRDELQKLLVWYSNLQTPPAEFTDVKSTAAVI
jgi:hypothetical protein